jgi:hypothetical protein
MKRIASLEATLQRTIVPVPGGEQCVKPTAPMAFVENGKGQGGSTLSGADYYAPGQPEPGV